MILPLWEYAQACAVLEMRRGPARIKAFIQSVEISSHFSKAFPLKKTADL